MYLERSNKVPYFLCITRQFSIIYYSFTILHFCLAVLISFSRKLSSFTTSWNGSGTISSMSVTPVLWSSLATGRPLECSNCSICSSNLSFFLQSCFKSFWFSLIFAISLHKKSIRDRFGFVFDKLVPSRNVELSGVSEQLNIFLHNTQLHSTTIILLPRFITFCRHYAMRVEPRRMQHLSDVLADLNLVAAVIIDQATELTIWSWPSPVLNWKIIFRNGCLSQMIIWTDW